MAPPADTRLVRETIHRCLSPEPKDRPTALEVNQVLNGWLPGKKHPALTCLILRSAGGKEVKVNVRTEVGRAIAAQLDRDDSLHWDHSQFVLERDDSGWFVAPRSGTKNETMLNGKCARGRTKLGRGDVLGVGREAKGIVKLPLTVIIE